MAEKIREMVELDLAVVMPVYNEEGCIVEVVRAWHTELSQLGIAFCLIVLNDGSQDSTQHRLDELQDLMELKVVNKPNSGHGPTILKGYNLAIERAKWVFQVDSDDEMRPEYFRQLWNPRENFDFLIGSRHNRVSPLPRRIITGVSRLSVRLLFGRGILDVNSPYRLFRSTAIKPLLEKIENDAFAPNVILSGLAVRKKLRIHQCWVPHLGRKTGTVSIMRLKLWKAAFSAFAQTIHAALRK